MELVPLAPFDFNSTFYKPDHFDSDDGFWLPNICWQTCFWQGKQLGLKFTNIGTINKPRIRFEVYYKEKLEKQFIDSLVEEMRYRFNLDLDLKEFYQTFKNEKVLDQRASVLRKVPEEEISDSFFESPPIDSDRHILYKILKERGAL